MRAGPGSRRARDGMIAVAVSMAAATALASPALAVTTTSSISVANDTATPEQAVPVDLTFSGTNGSGSPASVEAVVRPAGGLACQSSYQEDISTLGPEDTTILSPGSANAPAGSYSVNADFKPAAPQSYQVCAWLDSSANGTSPLAPPATVSLTARPPQVSQLTVTVPKATANDTPFQLAFTTQTDQQLSLLAVIKRAAAPPASTTAASPCPASYELWQQQSSGDVPVLTYGGANVFGGPTTTNATARLGTGYYVVCTWVEGPDAGEVDDAATTPFTVGTPAPPPKPALRLRRATASRRHGVSITGATAAKFTGRLRVLAACGSSHTRRSTTARHGRFSAGLALPAGCRQAKRVKLTVTWAGSSAYVRQSASKSVAIKP